MRVCLKDKNFSIQTFLEERLIDEQDLSKCVEPNVRHTLYCYAVQGFKAHNSLDPTINTADYNLIWQATEYSPRLELLWPDNKTILKKNNEVCFPISVRSALSLDKAFCNVVFDGEYCRFMRGDGVELARYPVFGILRVSVTCKNDFDRGIHDLSMELLPDVFCKKHFLHVRWVS